MTLEELRELLEIINNEEDPVGITVHLVKKTEEENEEILVADVSEELATDLKDIFQRTVNNKFFEDDEMEISNISDANEMLNSAFYYDLNEFPEKLNILEEFDAWNDYDNFSFANDDIEQVKAILITIGNRDSHFTIYKHVYGVTIIRQDRVLGFIPAGTRFEKLSSSILQINDSIDFIYVERNLIVSNIKTLTNSYGYKEIIKNQAREKIQMVAELDLISNIEELTTFVENVKYAKRVLKIKPDSPVLALAKDRIIEFISNHDKLSRKIRFDDSGEKILLDTDVSKIITIGILNDDYLKSNLTDIDYESERKEEFIVEDN